MKMETGEAAHRRRYETTAGSEFGHSEISMSVVTDDTRVNNIRRRIGLSLPRDDSRRVCGPVNVEPVVFLISCCIGVLMTHQNVFMYWARCIQIAQNRSGEFNNITQTCSMLGPGNDTLQDDVERDISTNRIYIQIVSCIPALLTSAIVGAWSDRYGRKPPLIFCLAGFFTYCMLNLCATLTYESINVYIWIFTAELILGCCGGFITLITTTLAIITDDCRESLKPGVSGVPLRIGLSSFVQVAGSMVGTLIVSLLSVSATVSAEKHSMSYVKGALVQAGLALIAIIYTMFFVEESFFPEVQNFAYRRIQDNSIDDEDEPPPSKGIIGKVKNYTSSTFNVLFAKRPGWTRFCICFSVLLVFVEFLANDGSLLFLYLKRAPFNFSDRQFGYYNLAKGFLIAIGTILGPIALSCLTCLGKDSILIMIAIGSNAVLSAWLAFAANTEQIFYTTALGVLCGALAPAYRSFLPRMVAIDETARLLAAVSIIMAISPIFSSAIFNEIFNLTLDKWAGFVFFLVGCIQLIVLVGQFCVHMLMRPQWKLEAELGQLQHQDGPRRDTIVYPGADDERSVSNTAVDSGSGSRTEEI